MLYYVIVVVLWLYCVVLCIVPTVRTVLYFVLSTVLEDSTLYLLRTVYCTYCTLTLLDLINDTNEFWIKTKILLLVLNLGVYGFRPKSP